MKVFRNVMMMIAVITIVVLVSTFNAGQNSAFENNPMTGFSIFSIIDTDMYNLSSSETISYESQTIELNDRFIACEECKTIGNNIVLNGRIIFVTDFGISIPTPELSSALYKANSINNSYLLSDGSAIWLIELLMDEPYDSNRIKEGLMMILDDTISYEGLTSGQAHSLINNVVDLFYLSEDEKILVVYNVTNFADNLLESRSNELMEKLTILDNGVFGSSIDGISSKVMSYQEITKVSEIHIAKLDLSKVTIEVHDSKYGRLKVSDFVDKQILLSASGGPSGFNLNPKSLVISDGNVFSQVSDNYDGFFLVLKDGSAKITNLKGFNTEKSSSNVLHALQNDLLIKDGAYQNGINADLNVINSGRQFSTLLENRIPRSAICTNSAGNVLLISTSSRTDYNTGMLRAEIAEIAKKQGCVDAMLLSEGYGSAMRYINLTKTKKYLITDENALPSSNFIIVKKLDKNIYCSITPYCYDGPILSVSSETGDHAGDIGYYDNALCCSSPSCSFDCSIKTACDTGETGVLSLYPDLQSHVSTYNPSQFTDNVCCSSDCGKMQCSVKASCDVTESCIASLSSKDNAHIAACNYYENNLCCKISDSNLVLY